MLVRAVRPVTRAPRADSLISTASASTVGSTGLVSGVMLLGRTVMIGVPRTTWL